MNGDDGNDPKVRVWAGYGGAYWEQIDWGPEGTGWLPFSAPPPDRNDVETSPVVTCSFCGMSLVIDNYGGCTQCGGSPKS